MAGKAHHGVISAVVAAGVLLFASLPGAAAPSPSSVTVGVGGAGPATATVTGGPITGQGDNGLGQPLPTCTAPACESFGITLLAPAGWPDVITLEVVTTYTNSNLGTLDTYLEDSTGTIVAADPNSSAPSVASRVFAQPGNYILIVAGSTGAANSYSAVVTASSAPLSRTPSNFVPNTMSFSVPSVMDPIHPFGEPSIGVSRKDNVFVSGPTGTGTQRSFWEGSVDGGSTWRQISPGPVPTAIQGTNAPPGGGDTDIAFDNQPTQNQYFNDLYALACLRVAKTPDEGNTASQAFRGCASNLPEVDRQWFAVWDPPAGVTSSSLYTGPRPLVYIEYGPAPSTWVKSNDGLNYTSAAAARSFGADGYPAIDQVTGKVFEATYRGSKILLNIGTPDSSGNLTFLDGTGGTGLITVASQVINSGDVANFVVSSMDSSRNLYVVWVNRSNVATERQVFVSAASAASGWTNWTPPVQVSDGQASTGDRVNVFPWIKAGGPGRADAVWYGDKSTLDPSSTAAGHVWNVFMSQLVFPTDTNGGITGGAPTLMLQAVTPHPMDYLDVCLSGTGCIAQQGNRNLADFFSVTINSSGAANIVYDDMSNGLIQQPFATSNPADHAGAALVTVARQNGGPGLLGSAVSGPTAAPVPSLSASPGHALYPVMGGTNVPGMDLVQSALSLSGSTLTVTMNVGGDLTNLAATAQAVQTPLVEYVTRWQMGNKIYYAGMAGGSSQANAFYAGPAQTVDLCSVSACDPHVMIYAESAAVPPAPAAGTPVSGTGETGSISCPTAGPPSGTNPCTITITVNTADVGSPTSSSLLEEVGAYSFAVSHPQAGTTNSQAQADNVPLEIGAVCCYNFQAQPTIVPEFPAPVLVLLGAIAVLGGSVVWRRTRSRRKVTAT
jgi:hypothetical protein